MAVPEDVCLNVVQRAKLETMVIDTTVAGFSSSTSHSVKSMVPGTLLNIQKNHFIRDFIVAPLVGADGILGVKWFRKYKPHVLWDTNELFCHGIGSIALLQDSSQVPSISTVQAVASVPIITSQADPVTQGSVFPPTSLVASIMCVHAGHS